MSRVVGENRRTVLSSIIEMLRAEQFETGQDWIEFVAILVIQFTTVEQVYLVLEEIIRV
jgi:hypothetical protein